MTIGGIIEEENEKSAFNRIAYVSNFWLELDQKQSSTTSGRRCRCDKLKD